MPVERVLELLPGLFAPGSARSLRLRVAAAFKRLTGARACTVAPPHRRVHVRPGETLVRMPLNEELEVRLNFTAAPSPGRLDDARRLARHAARRLALDDGAAPAASPRSVDVLGALEVDGRRVVALCEGPTTRPSGWDVLTPRQAEVATLVAEGLSNREIGAMLRLSDRTVANHLQNIFRALGVTQRHDLAVTLFRSTKP